MKNYSYLILFLFYVFILPLHSLEFYKSHETINAIKEAMLLKKKGLYLRMGDGELTIVNDSMNSTHQRYEPKLQKELREGLSINGPYVFKTIPLYHEFYGGLEEHMSPGNHASDKEFCDKQLYKAEQHWGEPVDTVYSHVALSYLACYHPEKAIDFLLFLKNMPCTVLVGNKHIPKSIRTLLFGNNCTFIETPEYQAYDQIDHIEERCKKVLDLVPGYKVVITSMGVSGKALQKRLYNQYDDIFLFDFGSTMDALFNAWEKSKNTNQRAWIPISKFDKDEFIQKFKRLESQL